MMNNYEDKDLLQFARRIALGITPTKAALQVWPDLQMLPSVTMRKELKHICSLDIVKKEINNLKEISTDDVKSCLLNNVSDKADSLHILRNMMNDESLAPSQRINAIKLMAEIEGFAEPKKIENTVKLSDEQINNKIKDIFGINESV